MAKRREFLKLTVPPDLSYLPVIQHALREMAGRVGFTGDDLYQIELAAEEAITNVVTAYASEEEGEPFDVLCERVPLGLRIAIREKGLPFDPSRIPDYRPAEVLEGLSISGIGVFLMKQAMNEVTFLNLGMAGKETRLVKYLPSRNIKTYLSDEGRAEGREAAAVGTGAPLKEKIPYRVRRMAPSEAVEIARCAYKSHGYTFFDDHIYYPERIIELNETEEMISAVAVTEDNVFMGHAALVYPAPAAKIAEFTFVFVNQEYRGQGCMKQLADFLFHCPKKNPLEGLYSYAVTNHEFTQRGMAGHNFRDCGLLLASSPETWVFKGIAAHEQRISVALSFKFLNEAAVLILYPPEHHREMVEWLYAHIGSASHQFAAAPADSAAGLPAEGEVCTELFMTENCAEIYVLRYGRNTRQEVRKTLRDLCLKSIAAIQLFLRLADPFTYLLTAEFEQMGFFFAGILPLAPVGDALILQYLNNVRIDYDKLVLYTGEARVIRDYVRSKDPNGDLL